MQNKTIQNLVYEMFHFDKKPVKDLKEVQKHFTTPEYAHEYTSPYAGRNMSNSSQTMSHFRSFSHTLPPKTSEEKVEDINCFVLKMTNDKDLMQTVMERISMKHKKLLRPIPEKVLRRH